jgi:hypothetical protein
MLLTIQQQEDLVSQGLATKKVNDKLGLVTYKYAKRVMYDYLWAKHPELMECRGHTYDIATGELVLCPPQKSFNYDEAGNLPSPAWLDKPLDTPVLAARKWNGFMASARIWNGELVVGTTGTTNEETSKYVGWAKEEIRKLGKYDQPSKSLTSVYEIIHTDDPHIVDDGKQRAIYLLSRGVLSGVWPRGLHATTLGQVLEDAKTAKHEGWMVYDRAEYEAGTAVPATCKIKTDYYVGKKKLMRANKKAAESLFVRNHGMSNFLYKLPISWWSLAAAIPSYTTQDVWVSSTDQQRRAIIEALEPEFYD